MIKVNNTVSHKTSQGDVIVTKGKLVLIDAPAGGHNQIIATGKLIDGIPLAQIPIIISETEKIEVGDWVYNASNKTIFQAEQVHVNLQNQRDRHELYKILALPEHFSSKHLQAIVEGKMKDGDEVYVECTKINFETPTGTVYDTISRIKLNSDNHITLHKVEQKRHYITQEELEILYKMALESNYSIAKYNGAYREGYLDSYNRFKRFLKEE